MLKHLLGTSLLVVGMLLQGHAQSVEKLSDGYVKEYISTQIKSIDTDTTQQALKNEQKVQVGMSAGTSVSFGGGGAGTSTWLAPNLSYRVSPRFTIAAGLSLVMNTGNRFGYSIMDGSNVSFFRPSASYLMYASGSYDVNKKVRLTGTVFTGTQVYNLPGMKASSYNLNTYGGSLNVEYKLTPHSSISAGVQVSHGPSYGSSVSPLHDVR